MKPGTNIKWQARRALHGARLWPTLEKGRLLASLVSKRPHERDFAFFSRFEGKPGLFLDVGANIGQSAVSFRIYNRSFDILSLEPNPLLEPELRFVKRLLGSRFQYRMVGAGERDETRPIYVPRVQGVPFPQEASFVPGQLARDPAFRNRLRAATGRDDRPVELSEVPLSILRVDGLGIKPSVVKLDVQGFELEALRGMTETLATARPLLMIENGEGMAELRELLVGMGYSEPRSCRGTSLGALDPQHPSLNLFFVPDEKAGEWTGQGWISG
ncbi:MAG TPA: FkbM family methyltransferase [Bdellovibrionota bacterium]|nr:FkbM family methyltransferase [Bdellovibrionota bacterium]